MSAANNFLRSVIDSGDRQAFQRATPDLFREDETTAFDAIRDYLSQYGELPTITVLREQGVALPKLRNPGTTSYYLRRLKDRAVYTGVNELHPQLRAAMETQNVADVIDVVRRMSILTGKSSGGSGVSTAAAEVEGVIEDYLMARMSDGGLIGIPTGWATLDDATLGFVGGDLISIAGRPSIGKSYILMEMAYAARQSGARVTFVTMEMTKRQIVRRWVGRMTGINPKKIRLGNLDTYQHQRVLAAMDHLQHDTGLFFVDGSKCRSTAQVNAVVAETDPSALYIDSAYLLNPTATLRGGAAAHERISEVVADLRTSALDHEIPIAATFQFNRNRKSNSDKEPDMGDVAGSDSIGKDSSILLGIRFGNGPDSKASRIITVMKQREGETPEFAINFGFNPVNMSERPMTEVGSTDTDHIEAITGWMP